MSWQQIDTALRASNSILISAHVNPDGDCIGAQMALAWYCKSLGKEVRVYNKTNPPKKFRFLDGWEIVSDEVPRRDWDTFVILDSSNPQRLGWDVSTISANTVIDIDHHRDNYRGGDINMVDPSAAATSLLLCEFFVAIKADFPIHVAEALYVGLISDTGGFRFANTDSRVLRAAADLVDRGVEPQKLNKQLFATFTSAGLALRAKVWQTLEYHFDGKLCLLVLDSSLIDKMGADYGDLEGMSDQTLGAEGVQVGMLIKIKGVETHFSMRSNGLVDVGIIAQNVPGGGGHACAAGCTLEMPFEEAKSKMLGFIEIALRG